MYSQHKHNHSLPRMIDIGVHLHSKCQCFGSQKVNVLPEIGFLYTKIREKGGSLHTWTTLMGYHLFTRVGGPGPK